MSPHGFQVGPRPPLCHCSIHTWKTVHGGASPGQVCLSAWGRKAVSFSWPLTPWTMTLCPVHCFLSGGISALEDSVFCATPAAAHTAISHIPVSSCPDSAGYQPGPRLFVERQGLRIAKGGSRSGKLLFLLGQSLGPLLWGLRCVQWSSVHAGSQPRVDT